MSAVCNCVGGRGVGVMAVGLGKGIKNSRSGVRFDYYLSGCLRQIL